MQKMQCGFSREDCSILMDLVLLRSEIRLFDTTFGAQRAIKAAKGKS